MTPGRPLKNEGRPLQGGPANSGNHTQGRVITFQCCFRFIEAHPLFKSVQRVGKTTISIAAGAQPECEMTALPLNFC